MTYNNYRGSRRARNGDYDKDTAYVRYLLLQLERRVERDMRDLDEFLAHHRKQQERG